MALTRETNDLLLNRLQAAQVGRRPTSLLPVYPLRFESLQASLGLNRSKRGSIFSIRLDLVILLGSAR